MRPTARSVRVGLAFSYLIIAFGTLFYASSSPSCFAGNGQSHVMTTLRLALACTAWNIFASTCGALTVSILQKPAFNLVTAPLVSGIVAGLGFTLFPLWIYEGYGGSLFEITRADVSCFFTEGYGMAIVAPLLAVATLVFEWLSLSVQRRAKA